jgi:hypothetical protein
VGASQVEDAASGGEGVVLIDSGFAANADFGKRQEERSRAEGIFFIGSLFSITVYCRSQAL